MIELHAEHVTEVFTGFGQLGVKAEEVAMQASARPAAYLAAGVPVGKHLADQLMLPLGIGAWLGSGGGVFRTMALSPHATTHAEILLPFSGNRGSCRPRRGQLLAVFRQALTAASTKTTGTLSAVSRGPGRKSQDPGCVPGRRGSCAFSMGAAVGALTLHRGRRRRQATILSGGTCCCPSLCYPFLYDPLAWIWPFRAIPRTVKREW